MTSPRSSPGPTTHPLRPWAVYGVAAVIVLVACVLVVLAKGEPSDLFLVLVGGPVVLVLTAGLLLPILSPRQNPDSRRRPPPVRGLGLGAGIAGHSALGFGADGGDGAGGAGGDCGGGAGGS